MLLERFDGFVNVDVSDCFVFCTYASGEQSDKSVVAAFYIASLFLTVIFSRRRKKRKLVLVCARDEICKGAAEKKYAWPPSDLAGRSDRETGGESVSTDLLRRERKTDRESERDEEKKKTHIFTLAFGDDDVRTYHNIIHYIPLFAS